MGTVREMWCLELNSWTQKTRVLVLEYEIWPGIFDLPSPLIFFFLMKSAGFVFWKEVEMWEWINYFLSPLKIQKQSLNKCPESVKGAAFNHSSAYQI